MLGKCSQSKLDKLERLIESHPLFDVSPLYASHFVYEEIFVKHDEINIVNGSKSPISVIAYVELCLCQSEKHFNHDLPLHLFSRAQRVVELLERIRWLRHYLQF